MESGNHCIFNIVTIEVLLTSCCTDKKNSKGRRDMVTRKKWGRNEYRHGEAGKEIV